MKQFIANHTKQLSTLDRWGGHRPIVIPPGLTPAAAFFYTIDKSIEFFRESTVKGIDYSLQYKSIREGSVRKKPYWIFSIGKKSVFLSIMDFTTPLRFVVGYFDNSKVGNKIEDIGYDVVNSAREIDLETSNGDIKLINVDWFLDTLVRAAQN